MTKTARAVLLILAGSAVPLFGAGPTWDTSGNNQLSGNYYFREVLYVTDNNANTTRGISLYGTIAFNGNGAYTLSNLGGVDSGSSTGAPNLNTATAYSLSSSGFGFLSDPLVTGTNSRISVLVSNNVIIGSDTEAQYNSIFVAAPIASLNNSSFNGPYTVSAFFVGASPASAAGATYQLNPDGAGHLGTVSISGTSAVGQTYTQSSTATYNFSNNAAVISYPNNTSANFYSGQEFTYFSPDSNFIFGGSPTGFDIFFGVKNAASGANTPLSGLYYEAGMEENGNTGMDSFYGSFNATNGSVIGHERIYAPVFSNPLYGYTFYTTYPSSITGTYNDPSNITHYTIGKNGFRLTYGTQGYVSAGIAIPYTPPSPGSTAVYIDPTGIVNTASSAPYTAGISPGAFLTFYNGVNLSSTTVVASSTPFPTTLNNVQVLIDNIAAPIYYVSPTQVSVIVPYDVSTFPVASIQISNNNVRSNTVTVNVNQSTPGVFTSNPVGGIGVAALLDFPPSGDYYIVSDDQPAHPGDVVAAYLTGLGAPFPSNPAGEVGPLSGDSLTLDFNVDVDGTDVGTPAYAGLAPGLAGLYQINFTIPSSITAGKHLLGILGPDSYADEAYIPIALSGSAENGPALAPNAQSKNPRRIGHR